MAAPTTAAPATEAPVQVKTRRPRPRYWRGAVLAVAGLSFVTPLLSSFVFTVHVPNRGLTFEAHSGILSAEGFTESLFLSLSLAAATIALALLLVVPALVAVRLGPPRLRAVVEIVCMMPLVVPPIALVTGIATVLRWGPDHFSRTPLYQTFLAVQNESFPVVLVLAHTVLALPFVHRSLDAGLRAVDVPTLVEAARNCGASRLQVIVSVILPNLCSSLAGASFLTLALVLGEYTVASLLGFRPFAVWIVTVSGAEARMSVAVSLLSLLITWALLLVLSRAGTGPSTAVPAAVPTPGPSTAVPAAGPAAATVAAGPSAAVPAAPAIAPAAAPGATPSSGRSTRAPRCAPGPPHCWPRWKVPECRSPWSAPRLGVWWTRWWQGRWPGWTSPSRCRPTTPYGPSRIRTRTGRRPSGSRPRPRPVWRWRTSPDGTASADAAGCAVLVVPSLLPVAPGRGRTFVRSLEEVDLRVLSDCLRRPNPEIQGPKPA